MRSASVHNKGVIKIQAAQCLCNYKWKGREWKAYLIHRRCWVKPFLSLSLEFWEEARMPLPAFGFPSVLSSLFCFPFSCPSLFLVPPPFFFPWNALLCFWCSGCWRWRFRGATAEEVEGVPFVFRLCSFVPPSFPSSFFFSVLLLLPLCFFSPVFFFLFSSLISSLWSLFSPSLLPPFPLLWFVAFPWILWGQRMPYSGNDRHASWGPGIIAVRRALWLKRLHCLYYWNNSTAFTVETAYEEDNE